MRQKIADKRKELEGKLKGLNTTRSFNSMEAVDAHKQAKSLIDVQIRTLDYVDRKLMQGVPMKKITDGMSKNGGGSVSAYYVAEVHGFEQKPNFAASEAIVNDILRQPTQTNQIQATEGRPNNNTTGSDNGRSSQRPINIQHQQLPPRCKKPGLTQISSQSALKDGQSKSEQSQYHKLDEVRKGPSSRG